MKTWRDVGQRGAANGDVLTGPAADLVQTFEPASALEPFPGTAGLAVRLQSSRCI